MLSKLHFPVSPSFKKIFLIFYSIKYFKFKKIKQLFFVYTQNIYLNETNLNEKVQKNKIKGIRFYLHKTQLKISEIKRCRTKHSIVYKNC